MSKVDDELTRRLHGAERPVDADGLFKGLERRRSHRERLRKVQAGLLAFAVLAATAGGFVALREVFGETARDVGESPVLPGNGEIVFSAEGKDGYSHLYAMQPDGSGRRQITDFGTHDTDPAVSPDGGTIAFVHRFEDASPAIATIPIEGGTVAWLTDPALASSDPAWSPDGSEIAFVVDSTTLYVASSTGRNAQPVVTDIESEIADPSWSPDGSRIVFVARGAGMAPGTPWSLVSVRRDGTLLEPVERSPGEERSPVWSPDGSLIAFIRPYGQGDGVWAIPDRGGEPSLLASTTHLDADLAWTSDGSALLVSDGASIYALASTPSGTPSANVSRIGSGTMPAWRPLPAGLTSSPLPTPPPQPSPSHSSDLGVVEVGLNFQLCDAARLDGIDWFGDGTRGIAWTGARMTPEGRCPEDMSASVVAADLHGDGIADTWSSIEHCVHCEPWGATDLDANGAQELVVLLQGGTTPQYGFYFAVPEGLPRSSGIHSISVAPPGAPDAGFPGNRPLTIWAGGDEGFSYAIRCEAAPDGPRVLVVASSHQPVDTNTLEIHVTRLELRTSPDLVDSAFQVLDTASPAESSEDFGGDAKACGVDFNPWA